VSSGRDVPPAGRTDSVPHTTGEQARCAAGLRWACASHGSGNCHETRSKAALSAAEPRRATGGVPPRRGLSAVAVLGHDQITTRDPATPGARRHPSRDNSPCGPNGHTGDVFANRNGGGRHLPTRRLYVEGPWIFEWETFFVDTLRVAVFH